MIEARPPVSDARTLPIAFLFAALAATPPALAGQADSALLDGPCLREETGTRPYGELLEAQRRARREAGRDTTAGRSEAIRIQKEIVRLQCDNAWRWMGLARMYLDAGRPGDAVAVIDHIEPWAANEIERSAEGYATPLEGLRETEAFRGSELARRMAARREAHHRRLEPFRATLDDLDDRPPERYVAEDACPFECCVYREWYATAATELVARVGGDSVVATVATGDTVRGLTGEVHVDPAPVAVVHRPKHGDGVREGDVVFLLDYLGEGVYRVWYEGEVDAWETLPGVRAYCPIPGPECWGEYLDPEAATEEHASVWWAKVEAADGVVGWTSEPERFANLDACG